MNVDQKNTNLRDIQEPSKLFTCPIVVCLVLRKNNDILLMERQNTGFGDGFYALPGGKVDGDERIPVALCREAKEEVGIDLSVDDIKLRLIVHCSSRDSVGIERILFVYESWTWQGVLTNCEPDKCHNLTWFDISNLPKNLLPIAREAISNFIATSEDVTLMEYGW